MISHARRQAIPFEKQHILDCKSEWLGMPVEVVYRYTDSLEILHISLLHDPKDDSNQTEITNDLTDSAKRRIAETMRGES